MASEFLLGDEKTPFLVLKGFRKNQQFEYFPLKKRQISTKGIQKNGLKRTKLCHVVYEWP